MAALGPLILTQNGSACKEHLHISMPCPPSSPPSMAVMCSLLQHCCLGSLVVGACFSSPRSARGISFPINPLDLPRSQHVSSIAPYPFPPCSSLLGALSCFIAHVQHGTAPFCSDCVAYTAVWDPFTTQPHFPHSSPTTPSCNNFVDTIRLIGLPALT